jgi:hypothetical protein
MKNEGEKIGNMRDRQIKTSFFVNNQYFLLIKEKSRCLLCSVSTLNATLQSLVLKILSVILLLHFLGGLVCQGITCGGKSLQ